MNERVIWGVPSFWIERFPLYYGRKRGFFEKRGINLEIRYLWGGPELAAAFTGGQVWIGEMGLPPFLKAYSDGLPARVIGSSTIQQLDHYLVARPEIQGMKQLKGRRIGILSFGSCDEYFARAMLRATGLNPNMDVQLVPMGSAYGDVRCFSPAPASGIPRVDAGFLVDPFVATGERLGCIRILAVVRDYFPSYQWGIILAHTEALVRKRELIQRAMEAFRAACRQILEDTEDALSFGAQVFQIPREDFRRALLRDLKRWEVDARLDIEGMKNCLKIQQETGSVPAGLSLEGMIEQF
ncbi:MAG: ABC transporter substrate-binding protein [Spirochaetaceae bacterium]|nr:MAG: ABC transporter substrate-binding protein [Spirochaetaceae bacterium]